MSATYTPPPVNGPVGADFYSPTLGVSAAPQPTPEFRTRKVAILGFGDTVRDCPWKDDSWELWAMNGFWRAAKPDFGIDVPEERFALWFDMHTVDYTREYGKQAGFGDAQERWLEKSHPFSVLMLDTDPAFPSVRRYPIEDVIAFLGRDYFTSTIAYALALALAQPDIAEIGLWGVDLVHDTEYAHQRPCAEYLIGRAEAMGINVTLHEKSALLKQPCRYGYEVDPPLVKEMRAMLQTQAAGLERAIKAKQEEMERCRMQLHTDDGALQAINGMLHRLSIHERGGQV